MQCELQFLAFRVSIWPFGIIFEVVAMPEDSSDYGGLLSQLIQRDCAINVVQMSSCEFRVSFFCDGDNCVWAFSVYLLL